jgi:hypothetical protein
VEEAVACMELAEKEKFNKKSLRKAFPHMPLDELWA